MHNEYVAKPMYSTLVHAGDDWDQMWASLTSYLPAVKARVSPREPFPVSLRLSAESANSLAADVRARHALRGFFDEQDMYLCTVNAFPYGPFKGRRVKEQVYEPDWRSQERLDYTLTVANLVAELAPHGTSPSIQTVPL